MVLDIFLHLIRQKTYIPLSLLSHIPLYYRLEYQPLERLFRSVTDLTTKAFSDLTEHTLLSAVL